MWCSTRNDPIHSHGYMTKSQRSSTPHFLSDDVLINFRDHIGVELHLSLDI